MASLAVTQFRIALLVPNGCHRISTLLMQKRENMVKRAGQPPFGITLACGASFGANKWQWCADIQAWMPISAVRICRVNFCPVEIPMLCSAGLAKAFLCRISPLIALCQKGLPTCSICYFSLSCFPTLPISLTSQQLSFLLGKQWVEPARPQCAWVPQCPLGRLSPSLCVLSFRAIFQDLARKQVMSPQLPFLTPHSTCLNSC